MAADICRRNGLGSLDVVNDLDSMTDEEYERDDSEESFNTTLTPSGYTASGEPKLSGFELLLKCADDAKRTSEERMNPQPQSKVNAAGFGRQDIVRNIAAVVNHFGFESDDDILRIRTQIAANLYLAGLADTDMIFKALNKDSVVYAAVNEYIRMYCGTPMDEKLIPIDIVQDMNDAVLEKLKMLADWELEYLTEQADADLHTGKIRDAHKDIVNYLNGKRVNNADGEESMDMGSDDA